VFAEDISGADLTGADRDIRHAGNPLSSTALAARELFGNPVGGGDSWIAQNATRMAIVWPTLITATFAPLAVRRYRYVSR
jgi:ABC-2 type transport system permease protein